MSRCENIGARLNSLLRFVYNASPEEVNSFLDRLPAENEPRTSVRTHRDSSTQPAPTQLSDTTSSSQELPSSSPIPSSSSGSTPAPSQTPSLSQNQSQITSYHQDQDQDQRAIAETVNLIPFIAIVSNFIDPSLKFSPATQKQLTHLQKLFASLVLELYSDRMSTESALRTWPFIFHSVLELIVASLNVDWQKINFSQGNFHFAAVQITKTFEAALPQIMKGSTPTSFLSDLVRRQAEEMIKTCRKQNYKYNTNRDGATNPYKNKYSGKYTNKDQYNDNKYKNNTFRIGGGRQGGNPVGTPTPPSIVLHQQPDGSWRT